MSHSSPSTHRKALSLPLTMPHSKSVHGPRFSTPTSRSTRLAASVARLQTPSTTRSLRLRGSAVSHSSEVTILAVPRSMAIRKFQWRLYQTWRSRRWMASSISESDLGSSVQLSSASASSMRPGEKPFNASESEVQ